MHIGDSIFRVSQAEAQQSGFKHLTDATIPFR